MVSLSTWFRYVVQKLEYSVSLSWKNYKIGQITDSEVGDAVWKNVFQGKLTFMHWNKGEEMAPEFGGLAGTLLVRRIPAADPRRVSVGDVVVLKDPENSDRYLVRRLAATEGYEMVSTDGKDEPFILNSDQCWVLVDNKRYSLIRQWAKIEYFLGQSYSLLKFLNKSNAFEIRQITSSAIDIPDIELVLTAGKTSLTILIAGVECYDKEAKDSRTFGPVSMTDIVGRAIYCLRNAVDHGPVRNSRLSMIRDLPILEVELDVDEMAKSHKA